MNYMKNLISFYKKHETIIQSSTSLQNITDDKKSDY